MELSLTKLPWYAQVGAFVALGVGACGAFYYYYEMPAQADLTSRRTQLVGLRADITKGVTTAKQLPAFETEVKQMGGDVVVDGNSTTQTGVSDFVSNLEASGYFKKSIDIVGTKTMPLAQPPGELVSFSLRAQFLTPGDAKPAVAPATASTR